MKKLFTVLCATFLSACVFAQLETGTGTQVETGKGTILLQMGGDGISFSSLTVSDIDGIGNDDFDDLYDEIKASSIGISVGVGFFVSDDFAIGLNLSSESTTTSIDYNGGLDDEEQVITESLVAPYIRYYFGESGMWSQLSYGWGTAGTDFGQSNYEPIKIEALTVRAGYAISLNEYISLNPSLAYSSSTSVTEDAGYNASYSPDDLEIEQRGFGVALSLNVHL